MSQGPGRVCSSPARGRVIRGRGFELAPVLARHDAIGLASLRERVHLAGGRFEIFSQPGQGTRLHAEFPLPVLRPSSGATPGPPGGPVQTLAS